VAAGAVRCDALVGAAGDGSAQAVQTAAGRLELGLRPVFVSHSDFAANSGIHLHALASRLAARGHEPVVVVPANPGSVRDLGAAPYRVLAYREARRAGPADLVHAVTPRERVREVAETIAGTLGCPCLVHLEDDEELLREAELASPRALGRLGGARPAHPERGAAFVAGAAGATAVVGALLELAPAGRPRALVRPGFDEAVLSPARSGARVRELLGVPRGATVLAYPGNVVPANAPSVAALYGAVRLLRSGGLEAVLLKSGLDSVALPREGVLDLGWIARRRIPELLAAADVLVQPGSPGPWDDRRLPAKLPEFLASGRPVVLPRANLGRELEDGREALLLDRGDAGEIAERVAVLAGDSDLRARVGEAGRDFALRELGWDRAVDALERVYRDVLVTTS
jgi:glycosyltransferase involved in cell wall biosynthesis